MLTKRMVLCLMIIIADPVVWIDFFKARIRGPENVKAFETVQLLHWNIVYPWNWVIGKPYKLRVNAFVGTYY